jgi:hypothetical protein
MAAQVATRVSMTHRFRLREANEPVGSRAVSATIGLTRWIRKPGQVRLHLQLERLRREAATASRWLSLKSICEKTGTVVTAEFVFCRLTFSLIDRAALGAEGMCSSALPNSTEGYPSWQRRTQHESRAKFRLRIHRIFKECLFAGLSQRVSVEIKCITTGKGVRLQ